MAVSSGRPSGVPRNFIQKPNRVKASKVVQLGTATGVTVLAGPAAGSGKKRFLNKILFSEVSGSNRTWDLHLVKSGATEDTTNYSDSMGHQVAITANNVVMFDYTDESGDGIELDPGDVITGLASATHAVTLTISYADEL